MTAKWGIGESKKLFSVEPPDAFPLRATQVVVVHDERLERRVQKNYRLQEQEMWVSRIRISSSEDIKSRQAVTGAERKGLDVKRQRSRVQVVWWWYSRKRVA